MVGRIIEIDAINGRLFEYSEEATFPFLVSAVVGDVPVVNDYVTFDISWIESTRSVTNVQKRS